LIIELRRAFSPEDLVEEDLGRRNPDRFPTIEEFEEDLKLYPEPIWSSAEEMDRADEDAFSKGYRQSFIRRAQRQ
jgi:hypothetical protein